MTIRTANDEELRHIIYEHKHVIVKFVDEACKICKQLAPKFIAFSEKPAYKKVTFIKMDASENPVSSREVQLSGTPFFATYFEGKLLNCALLATEEEVKEMLDKLILK